MSYAMLVIQKMLLTGTVMAGLWASPAETCLAQNNPDAMMQPPGLTIEDGYYPSLLSPTAVQTMDAYFNPKPPSAKMSEDDDAEEADELEFAPDPAFPAF